MNIRVRGIVIKNGKVLLIKRVRFEENKENVYYVFPGGGLEDNETLEQGVKREVLEELGINVSVEKMKYVEHFKETDTYFFKCKWIDGELGTGQGPEFTSDEYKDRGLYIPIEIPIDEMSNLNIVPQEIRDKIVVEYGNNKEKIKCIKYH